MKSIKSMITGMIQSANGEFGENIFFQNHKQTPSLLLLRNFIENRRCLEIIVASFALLEEISIGFKSRRMRRTLH